MVEGIRVVNLFSNRLGAASMYLSFILLISYSFFLEQHEAIWQSKINVDDVVLSGLGGKLQSIGKVWGVRVFKERQYRVSYRSF